MGRTTKTFKRKKIKINKIALKEIIRIRFKKKTTIGRKTRILKRIKVKKFIITIRKTCLK